MNGGRVKTVTGPRSSAARLAVAAAARRLDPEDVAGPELDVGLGAEVFRPAPGDDRVPPFGAGSAAASAVGREAPPLGDDRQIDRYPELVFPDDAFAAPPGAGSAGAFSQTVGPDLQRQIVLEG